VSLRSTDYALLAQDCYHDPVLDKPFELGGVTYSAIDTMDNPRTGFQATAYQRQDTKEIVIAYRGTEFDREPVHDGGVDAGMVLLGINGQQGDADAFTQRVIARAENESKRSATPIDVTVTGHSLGGTLAEINAAKYGLHGETFNAYGAASLYGVPEGGNQVIDHVRAGDLVSAASPHFGEVRIYAAQQDIDILGKGGYRDDGGAFSLRNPLAATDFDAHAIDNFVPDSKLLGHSIIAPENEARYRAHDNMIDRYRGDIRALREGLSAPWEVPKHAIEGAIDAGRSVAHAVRDGVHTIEHAVGEAAHEVKETFEHVKEDIADGVHAIGDKARGAWNTLTHPGSWFEHDPKTVPLDHPSHPDHALFEQAHGAVSRLDAQHQRTPDERTGNAAAVLAVAARRDGLDRIDHAVLSTDASRLYGVQGTMDSPLKRVTEVPTLQALQTPVEQSSEAWRNVAEQQRQVAEAQRPQTPHEPSAPMPGRA